MSMARLERLRARTGASRRADVPPDVQRALDRGEIESLTLAEWLAIDHAKLMNAAIRSTGLTTQATALRRAVRELVGEGITARMRGMGAAWHAALASVPRARDRARAYRALATHPSDMVRAWAAYTHTADATLDLPTRLERARPFAADGGISVRECAWDSFRPHLVPELERGLALLQPWVHDDDPNVRRCAVEGTRPRGVWTLHLQALKADPAPALPLLEPLHADPSRYVQNAVANWLNDASKSQPAWTRAVCARWMKNSKSPETAYIVRRALRTLRKQESE